jgi:hypothetical protein
MDQSSDTAENVTSTEHDLYSTGKRTAVD